MNTKALIRKTREGLILSPEEIGSLVRGAVSGEVPAYQLTAWMMAVFFRGLTSGETAALTLSMLDSGDRLDFSNAAHLPADKHSTGGVGDKISFLVAPLVAAAGVPVPMISGRSLGHTGGTLDKLESIPGLRAELDSAAFQRIVHEVGFCIAGQSERLAPADKVLYALRDASSTVESIPLITASILSKKAAAGVCALALDVKFGDGAFMRERDQALRLARSLVSAASPLGIRARAHLTRMDRVLGHAAGNALEIAEAARFLKGEDVSPDLRGLTLALGGSMLELSGAVSSRRDGEDTIERLWRSGAGLERFARMVEKLGGDPRALEDASLLPRAAATTEVKAPRDGTFLGIRALAAGTWIAEAGGGRLRITDTADPAVGVEILPDLGESVSAGTTVMRLHHSAGRAPDPGRAASWIVLGEAGAVLPPLLDDVVEPPVPSGE